MKTVIIIGNGVAGITTAIELRKREPQTRIVVISGESHYHYSRPALMYIFMGHMTFEDTMPFPKDFWKKQRIELVYDWVEHVEQESKKVHLRTGRTLQYDQLVLATGSVSNKFGWPGQDLEGVQGFYSLQDIELLDKNIQGAKRAIIVGGGLIGIELAEMLHMRGIHVTFLIRESSYWKNNIPEEESLMIGRIIKQEDIDIIPSTNLKEIVDDGNGRVAAVVTEFGDKIPCEIVGLTPGVRPNISLAQTSDIPTSRGITVNPFLESSASDIYACGDCAEIQRHDGISAIEPLWYAGKMQGTALARTLAGERTEYTYGTFYNSAKFIDLEYQVYGTVQRDREGDTHYYWEAPNGKQSLRLVERDGALIGVNVMGIRYRHRSCEEWIDKKLPLKDVLERLPQANFDPEFSKKYEPEIRRSFLELIA